MTGCLETYRGTDGVWQLAGMSAKEPDGEVVFVSHYQSPYDINASVLSRVRLSLVQTIVVLSQSQQELINSSAGLFLHYLSPGPLFLHVQLSATAASLSSNISFKS